MFVLDRQGALWVTCGRDHPGATTHRGHSTPLRKLTSNERRILGLAQEDKRTDWGKLRGKGVSLAEAGERTGIQEDLRVAMVHLPDHNRVAATPQWPARREYTETLERLAKECGLRLTYHSLATTMSLGQLSRAIPLTITLLRERIKEKENG